MIIRKNLKLNKFEKILLLILIIFSFTLLKKAFAVQITVRAASHAYNMSDFPAKTRICSMV